MLCEAMCDAGGPNQLSEKAPFGAFFRFSHPPAKKTVMQSVIACGIISRK